MLTPVSSPAPPSHKIKSKDGMMNEFIYGLGLILGMFNAIAQSLLMPVLVTIGIVIIIGGIQWIASRSSAWNVEKNMKFPAMMHNSTNTIDGN